MNRSNHFDVLRLVAAAAVALLHLVELVRDDRLTHALGWLPTQWGLPTFFVLSGYLVYMSWELRPGWSGYASRRLRRILPAYVTVVLVCAFAGAIFSTLSASDYFGSPAWLRYVLTNLAFLNFLQPSLPGLFQDNPFRGGTVNGALWTIKVELMFYAVVPLIALAVRRWGASRALGAGYILSALWWVGFTEAAARTGWPVWHEVARQMPGQLMYFLAGAWAWCERERLATWGARVGCRCRRAWRSSRARAARWARRSARARPSPSRRAGMRRARRAPPAMGLGRAGGAAALAIGAAAGRAARAWRAAGGGGSGRCVAAVQRPASNQGKICVYR